MSGTDGYGVWKCPIERGREELACAASRECEFGRWDGADEEALWPPLVAFCSRILVAPFPYEGPESYHPPVIPTNTVLSIHQVTVKLL